MGQRQYEFHIQRLAPDAVLQRHPIQKFHGNKRLATLVVDLINSQ
jgi:hypothetical protein